MRAFEINVVLVRTLYDTNIGASSRAMDNMGCHRLILIDPKCEVTFAAQQAAASGQAALQQRTVYASWEEFYKKESEGIRISLSARDGRGRAVKDLKETLSWIKTEDPLFNSENSENTLPVYFIFGPEDWGLSAEDLKLTHFACSIPTFGENSSLNLGQAVLLSLYILRDAWGGSRTILEGQIKSKKVTQAKVFPDQTLKIWLTEMGFDLSKPKVNVHSVLRRMLLHNVPTEKELQTLEIVLQQSIRKLHEYNKLRKDL